MKQAAGRYSRQEILELMGRSGQKRLQNSKVVVIGVGAIGSVAAELLARAGIGHLKVIDRDIIEINNLQRQLLFDESDIGKPKATAAAEKLKMMNSEISIGASNEDIDCSNIAVVVGKPDCILDCSDNMETRFLINDYCVKERIPWIHAAAIQNYGTIFPVMPGKACFSCVFKESNNLESCDTAGILNTVSTSIAAIQATEAMRVLLGKPSIDTLFHYDIWEGNFYAVKVKKNFCDACRRNFAYLGGKKTSRIMKFCGSGYYQIRGKKKSLQQLQKKLKKITKIKKLDGCIKLNEITLFNDGRALIKAASKKEARALYSRYIGN
jgi:adenylyltransferase/sulfurtransferase